MKTAIKINTPVRKVVAIRRKDNGALLFRPLNRTDGVVVLYPMGNAGVGHTAFKELLKSDAFEPIYEGDTVEITF